MNGSRASRAGLALLALAGAGLVLRLAAVAAVGIDLATFDVDGYHFGAMCHVRGGTIPTTHHPPGYSWLLALFYQVAGVRPRLFYGVHALLGAVAVWLVGDAARRQMGERAGLLAATLLALNGYAVLFTPVLASENLALPGLALAAWLTVRDLPRVPAWKLVLAAATVAGLSMVRGSLVLLAVPLAAVPLLPAFRPGLSRGRRAAAALLLGVLSGSAVAGFAAWRLARTGVFRLGCPMDVYNLWVGNNPNATGRIEAMPDLPATKDEEEKARILAPRVRRFLAEQPLRQVSLFASRASYNFAPPKRDLIYLYATGWAGERPAPAVSAAYAAVALSGPILGAFFLLALARAGGHRAFLAGTVVTLTAILPYQASIGDARYLLPAYPALCVAAGALGAVDVPGAWNAGRRLVAAVLALLFFGNAARDVKLTDPALRAITRPGGSTIRPPYEFAR